MPSEVGPSNEEAVEGTVTAEVCHQVVQVVGKLSFPVFLDPGYDLLQQLIEVFWEDYEGPVEEDLELQNCGLSGSSGFFNFLQDFPVELEKKISEKIGGEQRKFSLDLHGQNFSPSPSGIQN